MCAHVTAQRVHARYRILEEMQAVQQDLYRSQQVPFTVSVTKAAQSTLAFPSQAGLAALLESHTRTHARAPPQQPTLTRRCWARPPPSPPSTGSTPCKPTSQPPAPPSPHPTTTPPKASPCAWGGGCSDSIPLPCNPRHPRTTPLATPHSRPLPPRCWPSPDPPRGLGGVRTKGVGVCLCRGGWGWW